MKKKKLILIIIGAVLIAAAWGYGIFRVISIVTVDRQIEDTNGEDTSVVTFSPETFDCKSFEYDCILSGSNNYGPSTDTGFTTADCDHTNINFSFGKISGVKMLQHTKCHGDNRTLVISLSSEIKSGNCEIAVYKNQEFISTYNINESHSIKVAHNDGDIVEVVMFAESAKGSVAVSRSVG